MSALYYPKHLSSEFAFKRFNAERFLPLPQKLIRNKKRIRTDSEIDARPWLDAMAPTQVADELAISYLEDRDIEFEDASEYVDNVLAEQELAETVDNTTQNLNSSLANVTIDDEQPDDQMCHLGENFDEYNEAYENEKQADYVMSEDFESNPLSLFFIEEL